MGFSHRLRVRFIGLVSMALLFSQIALAAHACPAMSERPHPVSSAMATMPCEKMMAGGLDPEQPTLCMQHCQFGSVGQVVDHVPAVFVAVTMLPPTLAVVVDEGRDTILHSWADYERLRERPPPLAHSIAHCCYRI